MLREAMSRLASYFRRRAHEREMQEEIREHLRLATDEYVRRGLSRGAARMAAKRDFGSVAATQERYRDQLGLPSLDALVQDVRIGAGQLRRSPVFTVTACLLLGLGLGASTAVYSIVSSALLTPIPGAEPARRVAINETVAGRNAGGSPARLSDMRERLESLAAVTGYYGEDAVLTGSGEPRRTPVLRTFGPWIEVLGLEPQLGRSFTEREALGIDGPVALVSHGFWQRELGGGELVGKAVQLDGVSVPVVGVLPIASYPRDTDLVVPAIREFQGLGRGARFLGLAGRLADGVTMEQAQSEVDQLMASLQTEFPDTDEGVGARLTPFQQAMVGDARALLLGLFAATLAVMMLTCLNLAGLMLARALRRRSEVAVRVALGASPQRVVRLFLVEGLLVALGGCLVGLALARVGLDALNRLAGTALPTAAAPTVDWRVAAMGLLLAVVAGGVVAAGAAWQAARADAAPALREGRLAMGAGSVRMRRVLVGGQVALSTLLLLGTTLLARDFVHHMSRPQGFESQQVLTVKTSFSWSSPASDHHEFAHAALERLATIPGVRSVGLTDRLPFEGGSQSSPIVIRDRQLTPTQEQTTVARRAVSTGYLRTIGVPLRAGEPLTRSGLGGDDTTAGVVVNESFARAFFDTGSPVGEFMSFEGSAGDRDAEPVWRRITGVVGNVRQSLEQTEVPPEAFMLFDETGWPLLSFVVAANSDDPAALTSAVREALRQVSPDQVIDRIAPLMDEVSRAGSDRLRNAWIMGSFSSLAMALVIVGLYGMVATEVAQRVPELGIRSALGARPLNLVRESLRHSVVTTAVGAAAGLAIGAAATGWLQQFSSAVMPFDPVALLLVLGGIALAAAVAAAPSVRRALRIDPAEALRHD